MKPFIAAISGILTAVLLIRLGEMVGHFLFPVDADQLNLEAMSMRDLMLRLPASLHLTVALGHAVGLLAGLIVARIIEKSSRLPLYFIAGILLLLSLLNVLILPHPVWFTLLDLGLMLLIASLFIATRKKS